MREKCKFIVHHIYFDQSQKSESNPEGVYSGHAIHDIEVSDPKHVRDSYTAACVWRSLFDIEEKGKTAVGHAPHLDSYYVLSPDQQMCLIKLIPLPNRKNEWFFTHPNTNTSTTALFPEGCGVPLPTQLPSSPEPEVPVPASIPTYWTNPTPGGTSAGTSTSQWNEWMWDDNIKAEYRSRQKPDGSWEYQRRSGPAASVAKVEGKKKVDTSQWNEWMWDDNIKAEYRTRQKSDGSWEYQYR